MEIEKVKIGENGAFLTAYIQYGSPRIKNAKRRAAVLVLPGGGYEYVSETEEEPVALEFSAMGFQAFTLFYSVGEKCVFPVPETEVIAALAFIRGNAEKWCVDGEKIALLGFSAGGHLAASVGVHWPMLAERAAVAPEKARPNALVLVYPCITAGEYGYGGIAALRGRGLAEEEKKLLSAENYVGKHTPPAYLCHTAEDTAVSCMNTLLFAGALAKNGIPFETHIFKNGPHGMSLATRATTPEPSSLPKEAEKFFKDQKILAYLKKARDAFSVWTAESGKFLYDVFSM